MPELTNENKKSTQKTSGTTKKGASKKSTTKNVNTVDKKKATSTSKKQAPVKKATRESILKKKETVASKAVNDARGKIVKDIKDNLKQDASNTELKNKEETITQKIKSFIAKIIEMQEKAERETENKKALKESLNETEPKSKYILEYYDLPYRYNETVVKILAQTPKRLFVYWDISDIDKTKYQEAFGNSFFEDTYPVLLVHNEEKNYTFEVPINDFANSWYLDINDPKSRYVIQLGRKFKSTPEFVNIATTSDGRTIQLQNDYVPITTSNILEVPNDHILFEKVGTKALYRNVKTDEESYVEITNFEFIKKMGNIYSIYDLYKEIYKNELGDGGLADLLNPSSMSSSGTNSSMFR